MKKFKQFLNENDESGYSKIKNDLKYTPTISAGKRIVSSALGKMSPAAGRAFGPVSNLVSGDTVGAALSTGARSNPLGLIYSTMMIADTASASTIPTDAEAEEIRSKDELLSNAMNPGQNPVSKKAPDELKREEWRRKEQLRLANQQETQ